VKFLAFLLLILTFSFLESKAKVSDFKVLTLGNVKVYHSKQDSLVAKKVGTFVLVNFDKINYGVGNSQKDTVKIWIPFGEEDWNFLTGGKIPEWSGGITDYSKNRIVLQSQRKSGQKIEKVALHELTHLLLNYKVANAGYLVPRWFNEGSAMFFAKELSVEHAVLVSQAAIFDTLVSLKSIDKVLNFKSAKANLCYAQSVIAVDYLVRRFGKGIVSDLLTNFKTEKNFNKAMINSTGMSLWQFEEELKKHIVTQYFWYFLFGFDVYVWAFFVPLLFALAYLKKRKRAKEFEAKWKMEEILAQKFS
jgi:hypothetical protein